MQQQPYLAPEADTLQTDIQAPTSMEQLVSLNRQLVNTVEQLKGRPGVKVINVKIQDLNMPFWAMVGFMVKLAIASIPAAIIIWILFAIFIGALSIMFGGFLAALSL